MKDADWLYIDPLRELVRRHVSQQPSALYIEATSMVDLRLTARNPLRSL
jgi:hypothetical protein